MKNLIKPISIVVAALIKGTLDATGKTLAGEFTQGEAAGTFGVDKQ